jgi:uncharacterized paraquat-inducible protein A
MTTATHQKPEAETVRCEGTRRKVDEPRLSGAVYADCPACHRSVAVNIDGRLKAHRKVFSS